MQAPSQKGAVPDQAQLSRSKVRQQRRLEPVAQHLPSPQSEAPLSVQPAGHSPSQKGAVPDQKQISCVRPRGSSLVTTGELGSGWTLSSAAWAVWACHALVSRSISWLFKKTLRKGRGWEVGADHCGELRRRWARLQEQP